MKSRLPFLLILAAMAPAVATAQTTATLTGKVTDNQGKPLGGAVIKVLGTSPLRGAVAKPDGMYRVVGVPDGTYTIQITAVGYLMALQEGVRVRADDTTTLALQLKAAPAPSDDVQLCRPRSAPSTSIKVQSITGEELQRSARSSLFGEP